MASDSSLEEIYALVNEPWYEELYAVNNKSNENNSCSSNLAPNTSTSNIMNQISDILLNDTDEEIINCQEEAAIKATEKLFADILRQEYPFSRNQQNFGFSSAGSSEKQSNDNSKISRSIYDDGFSLMASQIQKGAKEAMKFLPNIGEFLDDNLEYNKSNLLTERKEYNDGDKERSSKQSAIFSDELIRNEAYERVFLFQGQEYIEEVIALRKLMIKESENESKEIPKSRFKNQIKKDLAGDLRPLLILCSQAVSINDQNMANQLIKKIRQHSSPKGDWSERLAHYFVNGLEARLAGTGSDIYRKHLSNQPTAVEFMTACRAYFAICPYDRISIFLIDHIILDISKNTSKVHIIDYWIQFGFHWLSLFERLSNEGQPPSKIKITGVDNPQPGFRPAKRVEETGRRLSDYAKSFNIPFEYNGIISKLEDFNMDDLNIEKDEVIVVALSPLQRISDEISSDDADSPRDKFLKNLRKIKPNIVIHGVVNSSYNTPFFDARFKGALSYYSCLFDMLDSNMPRDNYERFLLEAKWLGRTAMNVIACEGSERVERPETYRQWHTRSERAGFVPLPVDREVLKKMKKLVRGLYHKEFVLDEDNNWLVSGWKGRILFAQSTWKCSDN